MAKLSSEESDRLQLPKESAGKVIKQSEGEIEGKKVKSSGKKE